MSNLDMTGLNKRKLLFLNLFGSGGGVNLKLCWTPHGEIDGVKGRRGGGVIGLRKLLPNVKQKMWKPWLFGHKYSEIRQFGNG